MVYIPPKKGRSHVLRIIRELIEFEPKSKLTNVTEALKFLSNVMKKKAIVFVLSDFITVVGVADVSPVTSLSSSFVI